MLVYEVDVSPVDNVSDVILRCLRTIVGGKEVGHVDLPRETVRIGGLKFHEGDTVRLELRDIDGAGNQSPPATVDFVATDTIPPEAPKGFGVHLVREDRNATDHLEAVEAHRADGKVEIAPKKSVAASRVPELAPTPEVAPEKPRKKGPQKFNFDGGDE